MNSLNQYIIEKLRINKDSKNKYNYFPKDKYELRYLIENLLQIRGKDANLNDIDVSNITDMSYLFNVFNSNIHSFNGDISLWDVSNVKDMEGMFAVSKFNGDISKWDVSNVTNMNNMFKNCPLEKNPPAWYHE